MRPLLSAVLMTALLGAPAAYAQTQLDHQVQKLWDNLVDPGQRGDPRTNWEREREERAYHEQRRDEWERRRAAERAEWCRYHPGAEGCGYRNYGSGNGYNGYYGR